MVTSKKKSLFKDTAIYTIANYIVQSLGVVNSIFLRRFMGPMAMGVWSIIQVVLGYCGYASFGTTKAMARDYPYLRGKEEHLKAEQLKDMVLTFSMLMSVIPAVLILIYLSLHWRQLEFSFRLGLLFITAFLFLQRFYDLVITLLRSDRKFEVLSKLIVLNALGGIGVTFLFVSPWGIYGLFLGTAILTLACLFYIQKVSPYHFRRYWNTPELLRELRLGIPFLAITSLVELLSNLDKMIIAQKLGFKEVGFYSIAMMAGNYLTALPMRFSNVLYPHMQYEYAKQDSVLAVKSYFLKPVFICAVFIPFLSGVAIFLSKAFVPLFLPKYILGIPVVEIYCLGVYFLILGQFSYNLLQTLDRYWVNIPILLFSIAVNYFLNLFLLSRGQGLVGVAAGTAVSFILYGTLSFIFTLKYVAVRFETIKAVGQLAAILTFFFGGIFALNHFVNIANPYVSMLVKLVIFTVLSAPAFWVLEMKLGLWATLLEFLPKKKSKVPAWDNGENNES